MIIDFHTHVFPDDMANSTVRYLAEKSNTLPFLDGTRLSLVESMRRAGIDYSVNLPVLTKPSHFETVNNFASMINGRDGIISFGGIHPDCEDIEDRLDHIKFLGLKGIKLHPDYQQCYVDDERYIRIARYAIRAGLFVLFHSGVDIGYPDDVHCPPDRAAHFLNEVYGDREPERAQIIFAHLGAHAQYDDVIKYLAGRNVYFDLGYVLNEPVRDDLIRIIKVHGADRILFATDSPWAGQEECIKTIYSYGIPDDELEVIMGGNAAVMLGLT